MLVSDHGASRLAVIYEQENEKLELEEKANTVDVVVGLKITRKFHMFLIGMAMQFWQIMKGSRVHERQMWRFMAVLLWKR